MLSFHLGNDVLSFAIKTKQNVAVLMYMLLSAFTSNILFDSYLLLPVYHILVTGTITLKNVEYDKKTVVKFDVALIVLYASVVYLNMHLLVKEVW